MCVCVCVSTSKAKLLMYLPLKTNKPGSLKFTDSTMPIRGRDNFFYRLTSLFLCNIRSLHCGDFLDFTQSPSQILEYKPKIRLVHFLPIMHS